ncbi:MAG TPA: hypothetical protein DEA46_04495 [Candidatus Moranbacteria bacterium]|nr:hypothetical protein [Candidatus Moranbacteria bacterium]
MKNKPTSLREMHVSKSDGEKKTYLSYINDEYLLSIEDEELEEKIQEKDFKEPEIEAEILSTDSKAKEIEQTEKADYRRQEDDTRGKEENFLSRIKIYWVRNYPELIVKEILIKIISTVVIGVLSFVGGFWLKGSVSDKKIDDLKKDFDERLTKIQNNNSTTTQEIVEDFYNKKTEEINLNIDNKIDKRLDILEAIKNVNNKTN